MKLQNNNYQAFIYLWRDRLHKKYYLGYHNGSNPNYICSSKIVKTEYRLRPQDFKRRIIQTGTIKDMSALERRLLQKRSQYFGNRYYNKMIPSDKGFKVICWNNQMRAKVSARMKGKKLSEETKKKMAEATRLRMANMTPEQKLQWIKNVQKNHGGGPPKTGQGSRPHFIPYNKGQRMSLVYKKACSNNMKIYWAKKKSKTEVF